MLALRERPAYRYELSATNVGFADWAFRPRGEIARFDESNCAPLPALAGNALDARFRSWRGASGRGYVFSVYDRQSCPAYEQAVVIVASVEPNGARRVIFTGDTGFFPDIVLAGASKTGPADREIEFHMHLLATSAAQRTAVIADLAQAARS
jgi:hypothetical protein